MKQIKDYTKEEVIRAYEGIKTGLILNASQPITIEFLLESLEQVKARAEELGIRL